MLTQTELDLLRRLRNVRREAITATQPAIVSIHIDGQGKVKWFVAGKGEGT